MIYTFYSYKGGVGRSMALANVAEYLYRKGLRVIMIDWDLEAPGLESFYFNPREEQGQETLRKIRSQLGLMDMLLAYKDQFSGLFRADRPASNEEEENSDARQLDNGSSDQKAELAAHIRLLRKELPSIKAHLYPIHGPGSLSEAPQAALFLMQAGWREGERFGAYSRAVQSFDWTDFYVSYKGKAFFEWMRQELEDLSDVILVDSRTGVTEMGGVCTRQLADVVVSCSVLNSQNMEGVARMMKSFTREEVMAARDGRRIDNIVVPTRIDTSEIDARAKLLDVFDQTMGEVPIQFKEVKTSYWNLSIPYVSKYAYLERLAVGSNDRAYELQDAYKRLAAHLVLFCSEGSAPRTKLARELDQFFRITETRTPLMAPPLPPAFVERIPEIQALKEAFAIPSSDNSQKIVVVCAAPGSGKTVMAAAFAREGDVVDAFKDGILWVTLGAKPNIKEAIAELYANLTGDARTFQSEEGARISLSQQLKQKCLIVIDDLCRVEDCRFFESFSDQCSLLITTRDLELVENLPAKKLQLEDLSPDQALELVTSVSKFSSEYREALSSFTQLLGGQPLLLKLAGDMLRQRVEIVGDAPLIALEYANHLFTEKGAVAFDKTDTSDRNQAVARSIGASLDLLSPEDLERYIQLALVLDKRSITITEVMKLWKGQQEGTDDLGDQLKTEERLQRFNGLSLIRYDLTDKVVSLDELIRSHLLAQLPSAVGLDLKAENIFSKFTPAEQLAARQVLTRLVKVGSDASGDTRSRVRFSSIDDSARSVVTKLLDAGILIVEEDKLIMEQKLLLADESLIRKWERLQDWIDGDREFLRWLRQIRPAFEEWKADPRYGLLRGEELARAKEWMTKRPKLDQAVWAYVTVSVEANRKQHWKQVGIVAIVGLIVSALLLFVGWRWNVSRRAAEVLQQQQQLATQKYQEGLAATNRKDYAGAINLFNEALKIADRTEFYSARGNAYSLQGKYAEAIDDFNRVLKRDPNSVEAYFNRGLTFQRSGDNKQALEDFTRVLTLTNDAKNIDATRQQIREIDRVPKGQRSVGWAQYASVSKKDGKTPIRNFQKKSGDPNGAPQVGDQLTSLTGVNLRELYIEQGNDGSWIFPPQLATIQPQQKFGVLDVRTVNTNQIWIKIESRQGPLPSPSPSIHPAVLSITVIVYYSAQDNIDALVTALNDQGCTVSTRTSTIKGVEPEVRYYHPEDKDAALKVIGLIKEKLNIVVTLNSSTLSDPTAVKDHPNGTIEVWLN